MVHSLTTVKDAVHEKHFAIPRNGIRLLGLFDLVVNSSTLCSGSYDGINDAVLAGIEQSTDLYVARISLGQF